MDARELESIYRRYGPIVVRRASAILGNRQDAEELAQDLFESFLAKPPAFEGRSSILTYLYKTTTNRALNILRDGRNRRRLLEENVVDGPPGETPEARVLASQVLANLPEELAQAAVYAFVDGMSHAEIAEILGCSRRHVGDLLQRVTARFSPIEEAS
ncbi:MAG: RNA polymerase sigma factor [Polyangiaceae bacterium]|nr:RNA polymerase sigma factor [Polyangiaceae bacterium]